MRRCPPRWERRSGCATPETGGKCARERLLFFFNVKWNSVEPDRAIENASVRLREKIEPRGGGRAHLRAQPHTSATPRARARGAGRSARWAPPPRWAKKRCIRRRGGYHSRGRRVAPAPG